MNVLKNAFRSAVARLEHTHSTPVFLRAFATVPPHSSHSLPAVCPSCNSQLPTRLPACPKCFHIQRIHDDHDYYDILDIPFTPNPFLVDASRLKQHFRNVQRYVHPDIWTPHGEVKVNTARDLSGLVNKAYNTLLFPLGRIQYILRKHGIEVSESDKIDDVAFISEIMDAREALEEAESNEDVQKVREENESLMKDCLNDIEQLVASQDWDGARGAAVRLRYLQGIEDAAKSWPATPFDH
ncbi:hypothetical protein OF83DRAFT_1094751 [Amylostereum chailletii]|nr:hypothetical protein OF83DRAFT_1094751 [Amylostereum chailletii]